MAADGCAPNYVCFGSEADINACLNPDASAHYLLLTALLLGGI